MTTIRNPLAALPLALSILAAPLIGQAPVYDSEQGPYRVVTVLDNLQEPWSMAFLPDGDMLVTEQPGRLRLVRDGVLVPTPISGVPEVRYQGQGGLLDVVLHPQFESNRLIYLSFSKPNADGSQGTTAVARARFEGDRLTGVEEIFEAEAWSTTGGHYGSRLLFDEDGYLFITVGDRQASPALGADHPAQDLSNHQGTVNRIHDDGRIPADNPFVNTAGAQPSIWSYGHRSPQGLALNPATGDLWQSEHGPQGGDELNLIRPGENYGWPVIGYGVNYGGAPLHAARERAGMQQPVQHFTPSIATSGLLVYTGDRFPDWQGSVFMGGMAYPQVARLPLVGEDARQVGRMERPPLLTGFARIRDIRQGPDGYVYLALDERNESGMSRIVRLEPAESN
ncbi:MAG: PQQ-dependent sugar dehydrogenase [Gemmatimonadota bacterium]